MSSVAIIGMGAMGKAIFARLEGTYAVIDLDKSADLSQVSGVGFIIIATRPQSFLDLSQELKKYIDDQYVISVMAGTTTEFIIQKLGAKKVIRTMPNLALAQGNSLTAAFGQPDPQISSLLSAWGDTLWLDSEGQFDAFTALAGCGPVYFLELVAQLEVQAGKLGFDQKTSQLIANKTLIAAATILGEGSAKEKIKAKSTGQGVTEAALAALAKNHFGSLVAEAVKAAKKRSEELSK